MIYFKEYVEAYSDGIDVNSEALIPLHGVAQWSKRSHIEWGEAMGTLWVSRLGIYRISCHACLTAKATGLMAIQLKKGDSDIPHAIAGESATDTECMHNLSFESIFEVTDWQHAVPVAIRNVGVPVHVDTIDVIVERIAG